MGRQKKSTSLDSRLIFLSGLWTPCSQILCFKKETFLILTLEFWLFCAHHGTASRLERTFGVILTEPPHLAEEETEAQDLEGSVPS